MPHPLDPWHPAADPEWAFAIAVIGLDYALVSRTLARRGERTQTIRWLAFGAGLLVVALALLSPIEHLALTSMLSFHLLQNVMLAEWAPPLLVLGLSPPMIRTIRRRRRLITLARPRIALSLWLATWYAVHIPAVYDYALTHPWALGIEHVCFLVSGLCFWWPDIVPGHLTAGEKLVYLGTALIAITPLNLVIYLDPHPLYSYYIHTPKIGGISALADQQIAGVGTTIEENAVLLTALWIALRDALAD